MWPEISAHSSNLIKIIYLLRVLEANSEWDKPKEIIGDTYHD